MKTNLLFKMSAMALAIGSASLSYADGKILGRVSDANGQVYFEGAQVRIDSLNLTTSTKRDGRFSFTTVPAGDYELTINYLGAEEVTQSVTVSDNEISTLAVKIGEEVKAEENVIIIGQAASANRALNQMRSADNLISVVTSDAIGQLPDENVSEALQRISGVFIQRDQGEGRFVGVRGA